MRARCRSLEEYKARATVKGYERRHSVLLRRAIGVTGLIMGPVSVSPIEILDLLRAFF